MYQLIITLSDIDYKEDLFLAMQSVGITSASVVEAKNLHKSLESEFSLFTGFLQGDAAREGEQLVILCKVPSLEEPKELIDNLKAAGIKVSRGDILTLSVVPLALSFDGEFSGE